MKPKALTIGMTISVPFTDFKFGVRSSRRTISTPITSSPWMPALTKMQGPSVLP